MTDKKRPVPPGTPPDYIVFSGNARRPAPVAASPAPTPAPGPGAPARPAPAPVPGLAEDSSPQLDVPALLRDAEGDPPPAPTSAPAPGLGLSRDAWRKHPKGPHDPRQPVPWDPHSYPPAPAIPSPGRLDELRRKSWLFLRHRAWPRLKEAAVDAAERAFWAWLEDFLNGAPDAPSRPQLPPGSPSLPALPPGGDLPALPPGEPVGDPSGMSTGGALPNIQELAAIMRDPVATGAYGRGPLDLLNKWLKLAGIRHFSAQELTRQKWKGPGHTYKNDPRGFRGKVVKGVACWAELLDALPPVIGNHRGLMEILPEFVVPPVETWPRILPVLYVLDRYRHVTGKPVVSISGFRCRYYNWQIGGALDSRHMSFQAVDFVPQADWIKRKTVDKRPNAPDDMVLDYRKFMAFNEHMYRHKDVDGFGRYDDFMHIDVGTRGKGKAEDWDERSHKW